MVNQFISNQEIKNQEFNDKFEYVDNDVSDLLETIRQQQETLNEIKENEPQTIDQRETIEDMNITITELNDKIQEQEDKVNKLKTAIDAIIKQHAGAINKLSLAVYNIDESLFNQIFNKQEQG